MRALHWFWVVSAALAAAGFLPSREGRAFTLTGSALVLDQRAVRLFDNFTDPEANDNVTPDLDWPGFTGAEQAIWKGCSEWGSELHGLTGAGDPHQPGDLGSGGANFDLTWQGNAIVVGSTSDNTHSEISGNGGALLAFTETPIGNGWRIRYYADPWVWSDGPDLGAGVPPMLDLQGTAAHEYGHALGLGHSSDPQATMYGALVGSGIERRSIEADDVAGVQFIYGVLDASEKPHIAFVTSDAGVITLTGENFAAVENELWFTKALPEGGGLVKVTGLTSDGTTLSASIPVEAGPGDVLVKKGGLTGFNGLSNQMPFAPAGTVAFATALNIDIGLSAGIPSASQGQAAGSAGFWNGVQPPSSGQALFDLAGLPSGATISSTGVNGEFAFNNPATSGAAEKLLDDLEDVGCTPGSTSTWTVAGMRSGLYQVFVYSWAPDNRTTYKTQVRVVGGAAGLQLCGGAAWTGVHVEGGTFVRDTVPVHADGGSLQVQVTTQMGCGSLNGLQVVPAQGCGAVFTYCVPGLGASGCQALLAASGTPSAMAVNGFSLLATQVEGDKDGLYFWGTSGRQANPWGNGTSLQCVIPPVVRGGLLQGTGTPGVCDGAFTQDLNALWCAGCPKPLKNPGPGTVTQAQLWYRDPFNTSNQTTSLSNAVEFTVCP